MDTAALQKYLMRLFERHDVDLDADEEGWLVTDDDFPAIRAQWHEGSGGEPGRLDVDVVISEERRIEESFAGVGGADAGCRDALDTFERSAFHLLLAACWYVTDDRKMQITSWEIGVRTWDVFISQLMLRGVQQDAATMPDELIATVQAAVQREALTPELHWLRLVHRHGADGDLRCEALLDNEPWTSGTLALDSVAWPSAVGEYSARCFVMLDVRDY